MKYKTHTSDAYIMIFESPRTEGNHQFFISKWHGTPVIARGGAIGDPNYAYLYKWIGYS